MKITNHWKKGLAMAAVAAALALTTGQATAQNNGGGRGGRGGGNFDPAQMRERMMERYREALEVKDDSEWKVLEGRISKVADAQRDVRMGGGFGFRGGPGGRRGGDTAGGNNNDQARRNFFGEPSPEADALQKALESKASSEDIKAKLAKFRDARKAKEAALDRAQEDLRKVLTVRQEAIAVSMGLLK